MKMHHERKTFKYKEINNSQSIYLDVHFPPLEATTEVVSLPTVIFFHSGGLIVGNKRSLSPVWMIERCMALGYAFISPDYRLLIPTSGHEIVEDLLDVFKFVANTEIKGDSYSFRLDQGRIAVAGGSAGGLCACLTAIHCYPKPRVIFSMYGMGDLLSGFRLNVKKGDFKFMGQKVQRLDPSSFPGFLYPFPEGLPIVTDVPFDFGANIDLNASVQGDQRMKASMILYQEGNFVDYYTGLHKPSISEILRSVLAKENGTKTEFKDVIPQDKHSLFPQLCIDKTWPPTIFLHGTIDDLVPIEESRTLRDLLENNGVTTKLVEVEGQPHGFDIFAGAQVQHKAHFDTVMKFLCKYL